MGLLAIPLDFPYSLRGKRCRGAPPRHPPFGSTRALRSFHLCLPGPFVAGSCADHPETHGGVELPPPSPSNSATVRNCRPSSVALPQTSQHPRHGRRRHLLTVLLPPLATYRRGAPHQIFAELLFAVVLAAPAATAISAGGGR